ncbi:MAG: RNA 2',3'-cyclic phosphodiesterase [Candidatus Micrarchaeota archaeon]
MRAFLAVEIPESISKNFSRLELPKGMRPVSTKSMHITLKFLGDINEDKATEISGVLGAIEFFPFPLVCKGLGTFPNEFSPRILWAGIESPGLLELHSRISPKLEQLGFEKEQFTPHLTLARAKEKVQLSTLLEKHRSEPFGDCAINLFSLKKSTLTPNGPIYEDIHIFLANK